MAPMDIQSLSLPELADLTAHLAVELDERAECSIIPGELRDAASRLRDAGATLEQGLAKFRAQHPLRTPVAQ